MKALKEIEEAKASKRAIRAITISQRSIITITIKEEILIRLKIIRINDYKNKLLFNYLKLILNNQVIQIQTRLIINRGDCDGCLSWLIRIEDHKLLGYGRDQWNRDHRGVKKDFHKTLTLDENLNGLDATDSIKFTSHIFLPKDQLIGLPLLLDLFEFLRPPLI